MHPVTDHGTPMHGIFGSLSPRNVFVGENWNEDLSVTGFFGKSAKVKGQIELGFPAKRVRPRGITNSGDVAGYYTDGTGIHGFLQHDGATSTVTYPDPDAVETLLEGMNSKGLVSGIWEDADFNEFAFYYDTTTGDFTPITIPDFPYGLTGGVNAAGMIAVQALSADFSNVVSYIYCTKKTKKCPAGGIQVADAKPIRMSATEILRRSGARHGTLVPPAR